MDPDWARAAVEAIRASALTETESPVISPGALGRLGHGPWQTMRPPNTPVEIVFLRGLVALSIGSFDERPLEGPELVRKAISIVQQKFSLKLTRAEVARIVGCSDSWLAHNMKKSAGAGFDELLRSVRISEAQRLLVSSTLSVQQVAFSVGYASEGAFSRSFGSIVGQSPGRWRVAAKATS